MTIAIYTPMQVAERRLTNLRTGKYRLTQTGELERVCSNCGAWFSADRLHFSDAIRGDRLNTWCRPCTRQQAKIDREVNKSKALSRARSNKTVSQLIGSLNRPTPVLETLRKDFTLTTVLGVDKMQHDSNTKARAPIKSYNNPTLGYHAASTLGGLA
jgi:hypothetical protein